MPKNIYAIGPFSIRRALRSLLNEEEMMNRGMKRFWAWQCGNILKLQSLLSKNPSVGMSVLWFCKLQRKLLIRKYFRHGFIYVLEHCNEKRSIERLNVSWVG
jgi:hypothetical protein